MPYQACYQDKRRTTAHILQLVVNAAGSKLHEVILLSTRTMYLASPLFETTLVSHTFLPRECVCIHKKYLTNIKSCGKPITTELNRISLYAKPQDPAPITRACDQCGGLKARPNIFAFDASQFVLDPTRKLNLSRRNPWDNGQWGVTPLPRSKGGSTRANTWKCSVWSEETCPVDIMTNRQTQKPDEF